MTFLESLKIGLINIATIFMMSAKIATLGLLKIKVFWNKGSDVIISVHDVINKILSRDSIWVVDVVMWPKFGNSHERSYHNLNFIKIWPEKILFLTGGLGSSSIVWDWH